MIKNSEIAGELKGMEVAVTGATGFIGTHLVERLISLGARVEILTRDPQRVPGSWTGRVTVTRGDISGSMGSFGRAARIVFHLAGEIRQRGRFRETNVKGTQAVLKECARGQIRRFVYLSSVGVMGIEKPGVFDEASPCAPRDDYERSKLEAETMVLEAGRGKNLPVSVLRPSIVYGPGIPPERDSFLSLIRSINSGYFRYIGSRKGVYNIVYVGDVVEALLYLAVRSAAGENRKFIINDPMEWGSFAAYVRSLLHRDRKTGTIPAVPAFCLALGCELGGFFGVKLPFSIKRFKALTSRTVFSPEKIKKELGFEFAFGNHEGIKETIGCYRRQGTI